MLRFFVRYVGVLSLGLPNVIAANPKLKKMRPRHAARSINCRLLPLFRRGLPVKNSRRTARAARPLTSDDLLSVSVHSLRPAKERGGWVEWYPMMSSQESS